MQGTISERPTIVTVEARAGLISGLRDGATASFKGIRYAKPPIGRLRWRAPQPPDEWKGTFEAFCFGNISMQTVVANNGVGQGPPSEDCLTLNVFCPSDPNSSSLPVMVWIHGGSFTYGSGTAPLYNGIKFVESGVVLVTLNYRLGRFGFFSHPALTEEAGGAPLANYGLLDQIAALEWVRDNIEAFGGDPHCVTIFGESAGAESVNLLMVCSRARGLFHRAIAQSAMGRSEPEDLDEAQLTGSEFIRRIGLASPGVNQLRSIPADTIVKGDADRAGQLLVKGKLPILDGTLLTETVLSAFRAGREAGVPYIIGATDCELPASNLPSYLEGKRPSYATPAIKDIYGDMDNFEQNFLSDTIFTEPAISLAKLHSARSPTFCYQFAILSESARSNFPGAPHATDVPYVFGTHEFAEWPASALDAKLGDQMRAYWAAFARAGDPNLSSLPSWPDANSGNVLVFSNDGPSSGPHPDQSRAALLTSALDSGSIQNPLGKPRAPSSGNATKEDLP